MRKRSGRPGSHEQPVHCAAKSKKKSPAGDGPAGLWGRLHEEARLRFGIERFRPGQSEILDAIFAGRNVLALMPTGAGKSLCYQLPALFLPHCVLVVSPLLALMQDQRAKAEDAHIEVQKIDSTLTAAEAAEASDAIHAGIPRLVYATPERLENTEFLKQMRGCGVSLLAVDEVHCISQWGHDFRPAYLNLGHARKALGHPPVLALTATATGEVIDDILKQLHAEDAMIVNTGTERVNLEFAVHSTVNTEAKQRRLLEMIRTEEGSGIVYTASVRMANELYAWLKEEGVAVGCYHGRMKTRERETAQLGFMQNEYKVMVATKAFGLGIDKQDIRFVYHYEFPDSLETYYQEAGRAGRDGAPARAVLLYRVEDKRIQRFFMMGKYPTLVEMQVVFEALANARTTEEVQEQAAMSQKRVQTILHLLREAKLIRRAGRGYSRSAKIATGDALAQLIEAGKRSSETDRARLDEMIRYAESTTCRKQLLRSYFGEEQGELCGSCDNCRDPHHEKDLPPSIIESSGAVQFTTAVGTVVTTAPETLPHCEEPAFAVGDMATHRRFGPGRVLDLDGDNLLVRFEKNGIKRVRSTFLKKAAAAAAKEELAA